MDSKELYTAVLGIRAPWTVERVEMDMARQEVAVFVEHPPGSRFRCPHCERELAVFDHAAERRWRHLDTCQFMTYLVSRPPPGRTQRDQALLTNIVLGWNLAAMREARHRFAANGMKIEDSWMRRISPAASGHINMDGLWTFSCSGVYDMLIESGRV